MTLNIKQLFKIQLTNHTMLTQIIGISDGTRLGDFLSCLLDMVYASRAFIASDRARSPTSESFVINSISFASSADETCPTIIIIYQSSHPTVSVCLLTSYCTTSTHVLYNSYRVQKIVINALHYGIL